MSAEKGIIFNIQHFSITTDQEFRTTVFLKTVPYAVLGVPIKSQKVAYSSMWALLAKRLSPWGEEKKSVEKRLSKVLKDTILLKNQTGLTLSGGEIF